MAKSERRAVRWVIEGRVQGVGFRHFTRRAAGELDLCGWVRNRPDGSVEVQVAGEPSELQELRRELERGPRSAVVERITEEELSQIPRWQGFNVVF